MQEALRFWDVVLRGFFGAGLATLGFAVLFNIRGRALLFCSIAGASAVWFTISVTLPWA